MQEIMKFENEEFGEIECVELNGEALFNPSNIGKCLEIKPSSLKVYLSKMDDEDRVDMRKLSTDPNINFKLMGDTPRFWITEPGLYDLILQSRKKEARALKKWITHEVLPSIRKTGRYSLSKTDTMEINSSLNILQQHNIVNPYEVAGASNQSYRAKLANLINDIAKRDHRQTQALYEELYHVFAAKSGVYIPELAGKDGILPKDYLRKPGNEVLSENLYNFAVNYFYQGKMVVELIRIDPEQKMLSDF